MKYKLRQEIEQLIEDKTYKLRKYRTSDYGGYYNDYNYDEVIRLLLNHLNLALDVECKYPRVVLKTIKEKK